MTAYDRAQHKPLLIDMIYNLLKARVSGCLNNRSGLECPLSLTNILRFLLVRKVYRVCARK